jgi:DNA repair protein RadD
VTLLLNPKSPERSLAGVSRESQPGILSLSQRTIDLRDYQLRAIDNIRIGASRGQRRQLIVAPTGSGKSVILAEIIRRATLHGVKSLVIAHRQELVWQLADRLRDLGLPVGVIMAGVVPEPEHPIQVASLMTLARRKRWPEAGLLVVDEAHHARANTYMRVQDYYGTSRVIGATASPWRLDGLGLADIFDNMILVAKPRELIDRGFLSAYKGYRYESIDTRKVKQVAGDFDLDQLTTMYEQSGVYGNTVERWKVHANGRPTVAFCVSIAASRALVQKFLDAGVAAEHVDYRGTNRTAAIARLRSGETKVVSNCFLFGEGVDIPELEVCLMCRPTKSLALFLQMVGRVLRTNPGKQIARLHDHANNCQRFGLPCADRDYSLQSSRKSQPKPPPLHSCEKCLAVWEGADLRCPCCGFQKETQQRKPLSEKQGKEISLFGDIMERPTPTAEEAAKAFEGFLRSAREKNHRPGSAVHKLKEKFGDACPIPWGTWREFVGKDKEWLPWEQDPNRLTEESDLPNPPF